MIMMMMNKTHANDDDDDDDDIDVDRGRGFESYSGRFHSHKLSRLIFQILLLLKY